jgi:hypothetical protein
MSERHKQARGVIAYDPASGSILHMHFTRSARPQPGTPDPAEAQLRRHLAPDAAHARLLHVAAGDLKEGVRYRVDTAAGTVDPVRDREHGFSASAGSTRPAADLPSSHIVR